MVALPLTRAAPMSTPSRALTFETPRWTSAAPAPSDDAMLVRLLRCGDEDAFAALVHRYHGTLLRLALVFVRTQASAEDVVQDVWAGVIRGLDSFEERSSLKTWIFRILTNRAKTRATQEARTLPVTFDLDDDPEPAVDPKRFKSDGAWMEPPRPWGDDTPERLLLRQEAMAFVQKSIDELPAQQRAVIQLRDVEGESAEAVCNVLEINETNQRVLLHRARMRVRRTLEQYLSEDAHDVV